MESEEKRAARLAHMSALKEQRLAMEPAEEREARLARMRALQQQVGFGDRRREISQAVAQAHSPTM